MGGPGEHPPQIHRPRDVRVLPFLLRLHPRLRAAAGRGRPAAAPQQRLQGPHPDGAGQRQGRRGSRDGTLPGHPDSPGGLQPAGRVGEDARPRLPARRDQGSAPARRRGGRRRCHPRHQGLHRHHPQPHLQLPARIGERRLRPGAHPPVFAARPRRPTLDP